MPDHDKSCPFCMLQTDEVVLQTEKAFAILDGYPVSTGHTLVIPRYRGDVPDPRGGIRWVIPDKAAYWAPTGRAGGNA